MEKLIMVDYAIGPDKIRKAIQDRRKPVAIGGGDMMQPEEESEAFYYQKEESREPTETYSRAWDEPDTVINQHPEMNMNYLDYSDSIKQQIGGDPYEFDPTTEADVLYKREEPTIFRNFFQNQYDINNLPPKAAKAWGELKEEIQAKAFNQAKRSQESKIRLYNHKMSEWKTVQEIRAKQLILEGKADQAAKVTGGISDSGALSFIQNSMDIPLNKKAEAQQNYLKSVESTSQRDALINTLNDYSEKDIIEDDVEDVETPKGASAAPARETGNKTLTRTQAVKFLKQAGGDKNKARQLAKANGWVW